MSALDRGLAYGDGVFRTFTARDGAPRHWRRHYSKLQLDCTRLRIAAPDRQTLEGELKVVCAAEPECVVKVIVTRGIGERGYRSSRGQPTRVVMTSALPEYPAAYSEAGVRVRICNTRLARQPALAGIKHLNRLENVLARAEWDDPEIAEGILCDADGHAIGGTMTNLFIATGGRLATPDLESCGVAGVTRDRVIEASKAHGVSCEVRALSVEDVRAAEELFLVNSVIGLWPVRSLDAQPIAAGVLARNMRRWLEEECDAQLA